MHSTDSRTILRLLIALVAVTSGLAMYAGLALEHTLPAPLFAFVQARNNDELSTIAAVAVLLLLVWFALAIVGLAGLWWCRRWGRWAFTLASLALPFFTVYLAIVAPSSLVFNAVESGANTASNMSIGATLAMIWFGMNAEFDEKAARAPNGVA